MTAQSSLDDRRRRRRPRRVTDDVADQRCPTWSRDGRWIYFTADDGTGRGVWRVPATGGASTRLARGVTGQAVWESANGTHVFYAIAQTLWSVPAAGGPPQEVIKCVKGGAIAVAASGIYYASCNFQYELNTALHVMDPGTKHDRVIGTIPDYMFRLEVSPDEKTILYNKAANRGLHKRLSVGAGPQADRALQVAAGILRLLALFRARRRQRGRGISA